MKQLIEQNNIKIVDNPGEIFECKNCGAKFLSNEYYFEKVKEKSVLYLTDTCFTCNKVCIIERRIELFNGED